MGKKILAIDYSLSGSAFIYGNTNEEKFDYKYFSAMKMDSKNFNCVPIDKNLPAEQRLDNIITLFVNLLNGVDYVFLEAPSFNSKNSSSDFKDGYAIIKFICRLNNVPYLLIPPISNKLYFTGNGKAEKIDMVNYAVENYSKYIDFENISNKHKEDIADVCGLYQLGKDYLTCYRLPAPRGYVGTCDIKPYDALPLHRQQVIANLYGRDDLVQEISRLRSKMKKNVKKDTV